MPEWLLRSRNATRLGMMAVDGDVMEVALVDTGFFQVSGQGRPALALYPQAPLI